MKGRLFSGEKNLRAVLDAFPSPVFIVDRDLVIHDVNRATTELVGEHSDVLLKRLCGDLLDCIHAGRAKDGCGTTKHCKDCVMRQTAQAVTDGETISRRLSEMRIEKDEQILKFWCMVSGSLLEYEGRKLALIVLEDITELVALRSIIPICSHCRKVRNDQKLWQNVDEYFDKHPQIHFSHSICPECLKKFYSDYGY